MPVLVAGKTSLSPMPRAWWLFQESGDIDFYTDKCTVSPSQCLQCGRTSPIEQWRGREWVTQGHSVAVGV